MKPSTRPIHIPPRTRWTISVSLEGPSRARWTISASLEGGGSTLEWVTHLRLPRGLPSGPSTAQHISASLEGSEPTLEGVTHFRFARGHPSAQRTNGPAAQPLAVRRH